ncbi:MAG TPA: hypothetical protein VEZ13_06425 [Brevibacillus sp.]|nr:hypothetical protein [Brevibacillus sp.]
MTRLILGFVVTYLTSGLAENALITLVIATISALLLRFYSRLFRWLA